MKRKILWVVLIIFILLFVIVNVIYIYNRFIIGNNLEKNMVSTSLLDRQKQIDMEIDKLKKDGKYTINNPKIIAML